MQHRRRAVATLVSGLGVTMIIGYGALYYAFAVTAPAIMAEFGWSRFFTYGGLSAALLAGGATAPFAGRLFDRIGVRVPMTVGALVAALALVVLATAQGRAWFLAGMVMVHVASTCVLYDAAFTGLSQIEGAGSRRVITILTLVAGFSSTLFWPLTDGLVAALGWRGTYLVYAGAMVVVCAPLHWFCLAGAAGGARRTAAGTSAGPGWRDAGFALLALSFGLGGFVVSVFPVYVLTILEAFGSDGPTAIFVAALIGPAQVAARFIEMTGGRQWGAVTVGLISSVALSLSLMLVFASGESIVIAIAFALVYGAGQGLKTIAHGIVPLALFGAAGYGAVLGRLGAVRLSVSAAAPLVFAALADGFGMRAALLVTLGFALGAFGTYMALLRHLAPRHLPA